MELVNKELHESGKSKHGLIGIILILAGLIFIGDQLGIFPYKFKDIIFSWQSLLIVLGLIFLAKRDGKPTGIILLAIGIFFILPKFMNVPYNFHKFFWPILLIFAGVLIISRGFFWKRTEIPSSRMNGDSIDDVNIFGGHDRIITNENFRGGEIINIFGGGKYNLLNSKLSQGKNVLEVVMIFGGSKIIVPQDWEIKVEVAVVFGGFTDKRIIPAGLVHNKDKTLIIKGVAIFGGGEISSFDV